MNNKLPIILAFEGPDGAGKSSQLERTRAYLEDMGMGARTVSNPGSTKLGQVIREMALDKNSSMTSETRLHAMLLALHNAWDECVVPAYSSGKCVLLDRWTLSTMVYQGIVEPSRTFEAINDLLKMTVNRALLPTATLVYDVDARVAWDRKNSRGVPDSIFEGKYSVFRKVCAAYTLSESLADHKLKIKMVDAHGTEDEVWERTRLAVDKILEAQ